MSSNIATVLRDLTVKSSDLAAVPNDIVTIPNDIAVMSSGFTPSLVAIAAVSRVIGREPCGFNRFAIPANTTATVLVPAKTADTITESPESFRGWRKPPA
jgi:hypothetical protein